MDRLSSIFKSPAGAFLVCGTLAATINWLARIALSPWMSFELAVIIAYGIGMVAGFILYKRHVWPEAATSLARQMTGFIAVNAISGVIVVAIAVGLAELASYFAVRSAVIEAVAHGTAIAIGAIANYLGHGSITFAKSS